MKSNVLLTAIIKSYFFFFKCLLDCFSLFAILNFISLEQYEKKNKNTNKTQQIYHNKRVNGEKLSTIQNRMISARRGA